MDKPLNMRKEDRPIRRGFRNVNMEERGENQ